MKPGKFLGIGTMALGGILAASLWLRPSPRTASPDRPASEPLAKVSASPRAAPKADDSPRPAAEPFAADTAARDEGAIFSKEFEHTMSLPDPGEQNRMREKLFQKWVIEDAPGAANFVLTMRDENLRKESMLRVMQTWGVQDPKAALDWAESADFDNPYERQVAMSMACTQVSQTDPREALRLAVDYQLDQTKNGLLEGLTAHWAENDLPTARDWALAQPSGDQRDSLVEQIARVMFDASPAKAAKLVQEQIPPGENQNRAVLLLLSRMEAQDPGMAQAWVQSFPAGSLRDHAEEELTSFANRQRDE